ncbi:unnamed protein product [Closterium sp. NIES-54]
MGLHGKRFFRRELRRVGRDEDSLRCFAAEGPRHGLVASHRGVATRLQATVARGRAHGPSRHLEFVLRDSPVQHVGCVAPGPSAPATATAATATAAPAATAIAAPAATAIAATATTATAATAAAPATTAAPACCAAMASL